MENFSELILKMVLAGVIEQAWDDATNFKTYKSDYVNFQTQENRENATAWFAGKEFEMMCDIVEVDIKCIREELERVQKNKMDKIRLTNQAE
jgi:hypothetical protein